MNDETIRLLLDMGASGANVDEVKNKLAILDTQVHKTADATDKLTRSTGNSGQAMLQSGRVIQDFAQGGLGGILNNIEGLTVALGMGPGLAGILTIVGVAALLAGPAIKSFFQGIGDGSNEVPKAKDKLVALNTELKTASKELDELKEKQSLTNTELARFNELTEKQTALEKQLKDARRQRQQEEKLGDLKPFGQTEAEAERAKHLQAEIGGEQDALIGEVASAINKPKLEAVQNEMGRVWKKGTRFGDLSPEARKRYEALARREQELQGPESMDQARRMVAEAAIGGDEDALQKIVNRLPEASKFRKRLESQLPANVAAEEAADAGFDEENQHAHDVRMRRQEAIKKQEARKKSAEMLTAQGEANEQAMRANQAQEAKQDESKMRSGTHQLKEFMKQQKEEKETRGGARQIQQQLAQVGQDVNYAQAVELYKREKAKFESKAVQNGEATLEALRAMTERLNNIDTRTRGITQKNRSNQTNGL